MKAHDDGVPPSELMSISAFARRCGLTASALRFYDDYGLLAPADVDATTGYSRYSSAQADRAVAIRRLREVGLPLPDVVKALAADAAESSRLLDEHLSAANDDLRRRRRAAADFATELDNYMPCPLGSFPGPVLAAAIEQVLTATIHHPAAPALAGVRVERSEDALTLIATDRYRLASRSLAAGDVAGVPWSGTVDGDQLREAMSELRRASRVEVESTARDVRWRHDGGPTHRCRLLDGDFPDCRLMLNALPAPCTRVTVSRHELWRLLEHHAGDRLILDIGPTGIELSTPEGRMLLPGRMTGDPLRIAFALTTLHPAIIAGIGPDVMIEARGPDRPVTIRSADDGDLTTVAMPVALDEQELDHA